MKVAVVGAGIVGLAQAWSAAERGHQVTVFERSSQACGASIRNFGMVWPIGQPAGTNHTTALVSRLRWLRLAQETGLWVNPCGSIHLAHRPDEWAVLQEFAVLAPELGYPCEELSAAEVQRRTPAANPIGLLGGLWSSTELCLNPRKVIRAMPHWLSRRFDVRFEFNSTITEVDSGIVWLSDGQQRHFDRIIVCGGADFATLFPVLLNSAPLKRCKLQMLKTVAQPADWRIGPHLASGLTLRHYHNFEICTSLAALKQRVAAETPELDRFGIHVMVSQDDDGSVILGDSHEYDSDIEPFDKSLIDDLMLRELRSMIRLPDWTIAEHWHGIYAKHVAGPVFAADPMPRVFVRTGTGGAGMTMSFGLAELDWEHWE